MIVTLVTSQQVLEIDQIQRTIQILQLNFVYRYELSRVTWTPPTVQAELSSLAIDIWRSIEIEHVLKSGYPFPFQISYKSYNIKILIIENEHFKISQFYSSQKYLNFFNYASLNLLYSPELYLSMTTNTMTIGI